MATTRPLTADRALERLGFFAKNPPSGRPNWKRFEAVLHRLPPGLPLAVVTKALEGFAWQPSRLAEFPAHLDEAKLAVLTAHRDEPDAAFVLAAFTANGGKRLKQLLEMTADAPWARLEKRAAMAKLLVKQPELVAGAQAAFAVTPGDEDLIGSPYLPVLAADGSADSIDLLLPFISKAVMSKSRVVDDVKNDLLPLMPDTAATRGLKAVLDSTLDQRAKTSPALAFAEALGMKPPPRTLVFSIAFQCHRANAPANWLKRNPFRVDVDSTRANWFLHQNVGFAVLTPMTDPLKQMLTTLKGARSYTLRVKSGDKAALHVWARSLLDR